MNTEKTRLAKIERHRVKKNTIKKLERTVKHHENLINKQAAKIKELKAKVVVVNKEE